ncbi:carbohydrate sulfotransferase 9-like [Lynx canadensis]|uniref:carbohydrate sulfotransferase 9-like n=1 Tax=Lynx canadensis TaxID=61383 RepID=UPI0013C4BCA8|nr:carbohydrate sulfotransferase 9-like [Lynx canadensis]
MQPSEMVMNPKQVFLSVLIFGVAGLLLFMYLQVWIEEQHTVEEQPFSSQFTRDGWCSYQPIVLRVPQEDSKSVPCP